MNKEAEDWWIQEEEKGVRRGGEQEIEWTEKKKKIELRKEGAATKEGRGELRGGKRERKEERTQGTGCRRETEREGKTKEDWHY